MPTLLEWAAMAPWSSVNELADFAGLNRSTVSRQLPDWDKKGHAGVRMTAGSCGPATGCS